VVVDTPPVLVVTDPGVVAARADAVLLTLRNRQNGRRSAMEARNMLNALGANIVGIVVNGTREQKGYGYGGYLGYGFGYGSHDGQNGEETVGYYDADDELDSSLTLVEKQ
jgi:Mrp family chromosome partitioning ATPase